jgi:hypothetical protein
MFESVASESHKGPPFLEGGPFSVKRFMFRRNFPHISVKANRLVFSPETYRQNYQLSGSAFPSVTSGIDGLPVLISPEYLKMLANSVSFPSEPLENFGPNFIRRTSPLKPGAAAGRALGELFLDGFPHFVSETLGEFNNLISSPSYRKNVRSSGSGASPKRLARKVSKDYLNLVFGWQPLLSDLRQIYKTQQSLEARLRQIIRDNNRSIRRELTLKNTVSSEVTNMSLGDGSQTGLSLAAYQTTSVLDGEPPARIVRTVTTRERVWGVGSYKYYIPDNILGTPQWTRDCKSALFGLNPNPALLYELMPWSWLIDWFSNVGDVLNNIFNQSIAELIVNYAYLMRHVSIETVYEVTTEPCALVGTDVHGDRIPPQHLKYVTLSETKERVAASPFGFGLQIDDLSDRQFAILAALGLSKNNFR